MADPTYDEMAYERSRLLLWQRIQKVREEVTYIRKSELKGDAPYKSAVAHHVLLEKVRPHLVKAGIAWFRSVSRSY